MRSVLSTGVGEEEEVVEAEIGSHGVETLRMSDWKGKVNSEATIETRCETPERAASDNEANDCQGPG